MISPFICEGTLGISKSLNNVIRWNKLPLLSATRTKTTIKSKQQLVYAKNDSELFSRLYTAFQPRDGNLDEFFEHENRASRIAIMLHV